MGLVHGDLGTWERVTSFIESRQLGKTEESRLQYVVFVIGLFHLKMAAVDAVWHTYIEPKKSRGDEQGVYSYVGILPPKETGKFISNPGFRRMHDLVHHACSDPGLPATHR